MNTTDNKALADRLNVDSLAQAIREVDGRHDLGAGALAEALLPRIAALTATPSAQAGEVERFEPFISDYPSGHPEDAEPMMGRTIDGGWIRYSDHIAALTTPQPQGDASPKVSSGGERAREYLALGLDEYGHHNEAENVRQGIDLDSYKPSLFALEAALSAPQARPVATVCQDNTIAIMATGVELDPGTKLFARPMPAPTVDGGADAEPWGCDVCGKFDCTAALHPAPAPDVARLVEAARELRDLMEAMRLGEYTPDSFTVQPVDLALAPFTAAQPKEEG